ncbi:hypothetical protein L207DRAFT_432503 [Hyaloscypha variabilis F]|uniref:Uncharacterized protein n=1 Tax=Hyaloscypha variabilis (strain UAMH 11265 / GT02V1 / F) TaxID=1149755 RepID=A0A2J6RF33_HYAVF|nr:hypothetical protein L207DRAFT_432503 [Hyaloscypha variabilis F]
MRQKDDLHYQGLLERAKTVSLTNADIDFLNSKTRAEKESRGEPIPGTAIRTLNEERYDFNRLAIEKFAMDHGQRIWLFPATHSRSRASLGQARISVATMLAIGDTTAYKGPGILFFTPNMPFMLLANVGTRVGLTNGKMGKAIDVVMDDHERIATFFELDDRYILCNKPPICVLVDFGEPCGLQYPGLLMNLQPIFHVQRQQIPGTPAFAITDFKSQGHTKEELETDLSFSKMPGRRSHHYRWTSLNVQLGRLTSSQGLCLREKITRQDVSYYPDLELSAEIERLEILAVESWGRWNEEIRKRGVVFESGRET